ncbi:MAG TPA: hypothetical protein VGW38_18745 [Chloroflexota bacterium]|nr:hypothetical protein [Chloroflexota bacterium]
MAYGMQVDPNTDLNRALGLVKNAGFGWVKVQLRWENLEDSRGNIDWGYIDGVINAIHGAGLRPLLSIVTAPQWARPGLPGTHGAPANYQDFANFASAITARHKGKIGAIEVWNEQNLGREWGEGKVNAGDYVNFICTAYPAIKNADPNVLVISGAPTPTGINEPGNVVDDLVFVEQMYQAGLQNCMDALGAHPQGFGNHPDDDPGRNTWGEQQFIGHWSFYFRRFEQYRDVMVRYGDADSKIWFTEFGSASSPNPHPTHAYAALNTEQEQAEYLVRAFQIGKEKGYVGGMILWNLNFAPSADPGDSEAKLAYSVIRRDWSPRPAYNALASMPK